MVEKKTEDGRPDKVDGKGEETDPEMELERELSSLLNRHSAENESDTPDFILAQYMMSCLRAFNAAHKRCRQWEASK